MFTVADIIEHEDLLEMAEKDPKGLVKIIETKYRDRKSEILREIILKKVCSAKELDTIETLAKHIKGMIAELDGLLSAHEVVGHSPVLTKGAMLNNKEVTLGVELHDVCAKYVRTFNKENL